jgi:hypothetical protein
MSQPPMPPGPPTDPLPQSQPQQGMQQPWPQQGMPPGGPQQGMPPGGPWPTYGPAPAQQPPKKAKRFGWPTVIVTAVVALSLGGIVGGIVGGSGDGTATTAEPNATVTVTETADDESASKAPSPKKTTEPEPKSTISNGIHEVGVDVKAGQYKTNVPEGELCYWDRSRDDRGDYELQEGPARLSVTLKKGESFETEDCGTWKRV